MPATDSQSFVVRAFVSTLTLALVCLPARAHAQSSRAEAIAQEKAAKATRLTPPEVTRGERVGAMIDDLVAKGPPAGFYPSFGSVYTSGMFALGPGYHTGVGDTGIFDVHGIWSVRGYRLLSTKFVMPRLADDRLTVTTRANWFDATHVPFFGIGPAAAERDRTTYRYAQTQVSGDGLWRLSRLASISAGLAWMRVNTGEGRGSTSIEDVFDADAAPGLGLDPSFIVARAGAGLDWRPSAGYARRGGTLGGEVIRYAARAGAPLSFTRIDVQGSQLIPLRHEQWVIALRGFASFTATSDDQVIPYFLMPALGEDSTEMRGFASRRFRDRNRMQFTAEYRWMPAEFLDMALFADAGTVAANHHDLDLGELKTSLGLGLRVHTSRETLLRLEVARSRDGLRLILGTGAAF